MQQAMKQVGHTPSICTAVVAIGRNEGDRLIGCLQSVIAAVPLVVYVDSGSSDKSPDNARHLGVTVVDLNMETPFSAARARNAGFREVVLHSPDTEFVQFVDGDCEVFPDWLSTAEEFLRQNPDTAAICGRRKERYPEHSVYNELCDIEWEIEPGKAEYFGGDVMIRKSAFAEVGGYNDFLIAGEEPELAVRLRAHGWNIHALAQNMTLHDAAMTRFSQWWRRMKRSGYAYAAGAHLHRHSPERYWLWETMQAWIWVPFPIILLFSMVASIGFWSLLVYLIYPSQIVRLYLTLSGSRRSRLIQAVAFTFVKFPEFSGQIRYLKDLVRGRAGLIEYK